MHYNEIKMKNPFKTVFSLVVVSFLLAGCNTYINRPIVICSAYYDSDKENEINLTEGFYLEEFPNIRFHIDRINNLYGLYANEKYVGVEPEYIYAQDLNDDGFRELLYGSIDRGNDSIGVYDCHNDKKYHPFFGERKLHYRLIFKNDEVFTIESQSINWNFDQRIGTMNISKEQQLEITWTEGKYSSLDTLFFEKPTETDLDYWVSERKTSGQMEAEGHTCIPGWFGAEEYLDKKYDAKMVDGMPREPDIRITYLISGYPDALDRSAITRIEITDPTIRVCGLTIESTLDEIVSKMQNSGFNTRIEDFQNVTNIICGNGCYAVSFSKAKADFVECAIRIQALTTNITGVIY